MDPIDRPEMAIGHAPDLIDFLDPFASLVGTRTQPLAPRDFCFDFFFEN